MDKRTMMSIVEKVRAAQSLGLSFEQYVRAPLSTIECIERQQSVRAEQRKLRDNCDRILTDKTLGGC